MISIFLKCEIVILGLMDLQRKMEIWFFRICFGLFLALKNDHRGGGRQYPKALFVFEPFGRINDFDAVDFISWLIGPCNKNFFVIVSYGH